MGRGKAFNHKTKGHEHKLSDQSKKSGAKHTENVEYVIGTVASEEHGAVTIETTKDLN